MSQSKVWSDGPEFDRFLHAEIGEDRNGALVTVLSTLARLGLDPRREASELASLSDDAALHRLEALLARFFDVPALGNSRHAVAQGLVKLLPRQQVSDEAGTVAGVAPKALKLIMPIMGIALLLLLLVRLFVAGSVGPGG